MSHARLHKPEQTPSAEKNYMQTEQVAILKTLRNAVARLPKHDFDIATLRYVKDFQDPATKANIELSV